MVFHPTLATAYVLCELSSQLVQYVFNATSGTLGPRYAAPPASTIRPGYPNGMPQVQAAAAVLISADGRFLYATNRASPAEMDTTLITGPSSGRPCQTGLELLGRP